MQPHLNSQSVLVIPSWYPPRGGTFFRDHASALALTGMKVSVISLDLISLKKDPGLLLRGAHISSAFDQGVSEYRSPCPIIPLMEKPNANLWIRKMKQLALQFIEKHGRPDVIQAHSSIWAGVAAASVKKQTGIPYVLTEHRGRFVNPNPQAAAFFRSWHQPLIGEAFANASKIVVVSDALKEKIAGIAGVAEDDILTIPNLTDTDFFHPRPGSRPPGTFTFFSLAHLVPEKGMHTLISAAGMLQQQKLDFQVIIGGDGTEGASLKKAVRDASLNEVIRFTGRLSREKVREWLHQAHAFVLPSHFEAFGVVLIEAMACGLPAISTRSGGPQHIINDQTGILVDPGDPCALAKAMHNMIDGNAGYDRARIRKYATERFSPGVVAARYAALYEEVTGKMPSAAKNKAGGKRSNEPGPPNYLKPE